MVALVVIGFLALIAGIIMLIVNAVRKKGLRTRGIVAAVGLVVFIISASVSQPPSTLAPTPTATQTQTPVTTPTPTPAHAPTPTPTTALITTDASQLVLLPSDMPVGWALTGQTTEGGYYSTDFVSTESGFTTVLVCRLKVFPSIDEAKNEYSAQLSSAQTTYSLTNPGIGQEAFAYAQPGAGYRCLFRELNVVGETDMSTALYGGSLDETISWARLLDNKIH